MKILSISKPLSGSDSGEDSYAGGSGWSADQEGGTSGISGHARQPVQIEEEVDLQGGMLYSGPKNSKAALINDVGWGYDCERGLSQERTIETR